MIKIIEEVTFYDRQLYDYANHLFERKYTAMINELLEQDYVLRYDSGKFSPQTQVKIDFTERLFGSGWHQRELSSDASPNIFRWLGLSSGAPPYFFRWMGPSTEASLDLCLATDQDLYLKLYIVNSTRRDILESLSLSVNEMPLATSLTPVAGEYVLSALIPKQILLRFPYARLKLMVSETLPLSILGNHSDSRKASIAVRSIEVHP